MNRRKFIEISIAAGALLSSNSFFKCTRSRDIMLPKRDLGKTGEKLSIIGFGGILVKNEEPTVAKEMVARACDQGVNYFDVAPSYGNAEEILGPALKPHRGKCFLACKTLKREKAGAENELHESLQKLQTDHFDLYQLHALSKKEHVEKALGPVGAMELFEKAKKEGKIRFIGFSAHSEEAALLAMEQYEFDTILFPINFACWYQGQFGPGAVKKAKEKGMGILALKAMAYTRVPEGQEKPYGKLWYVPIENETLQELALRFTLSQDITAALPPGEAKFFWRSLQIASKFKPLDNEEYTKVKQISEGVKPLFSVSRIL